MDKRYLTIEDRKAIQQPLDKDGYSNDHFDKLYGKETNPYLGDERDRSNKKNGGNVPIGGDNSMGKCDECEGIATVRSVVNGQVEYQLCAKCHRKRNGN